MANSSIDERSSPTPDTVSAITSAADTETKTPAMRSASTKSAMVHKLLQRAKGMSLAEIGDATNWQPHSCRAFLSALRKRGVTLINEQRSDGTLVYRIADADQTAPTS